MKSTPQEGGAGEIKKEIDAIAADWNRRDCPPPDRSFAKERLNRLVARAEAEGYERGRKDAIGNPIFIADESGTINISETILRAEAEKVKECVAAVKSHYAPIYGKPDLLAALQALMPEGEKKQD